MKNLRKSLIIGVMALTAISMSGLQVSAAAPQAGDLIKSDSLSAVYFLGNDGKRYVYPNSDVFFSWHKDFSGVITVSASELANYPIGSLIAMRPGTKLVKITSDPSVYAVEGNGVLRKIQSEADAIAIYGANWAKRVRDVNDSFFAATYTIGTPLASGSIAAGTLVKNADSGAIYLYDGTNYRSISSEAAFNANRYDFANVVTRSAAITAGGTAITTGEFAYDAQTKTTGIVVTGSGLTASISANTAAATSIIDGQALADLASFNFTAANDGAVTIKTIKLKRIGISSDQSLDSIYLYDGATKLTDNGSLSNGTVTFSNNLGVITIPAGSTKTITVKADVAGSTGNIGMSINAASDILSTGAAINGSFPLQGNLMSMTSASDLAVATVGTATFAGTTINAGTSNATLWSAPLQITNKAVDLKYISFKQVGSIPADAIQNLSLYVNGSKVGSTVSINSDGRVIFDLTSSPVRISTGSTQVELRGDIIKGSDRTFSFSIQNASDVVLTDTNYGVNVAIASGLNTSSTTTVNAGNISVASDSTFTTTEVVKNATNVTFAKYTMKAFGEDVKVNSLRVLTTMANATSAEGIDDLAIFVDGAQVGSSQTWRGGSTTKDFGTNNLFTVAAGQTVKVEIRGTLNLLSGTTVTQVKTDLTTLANKLEGVTSYKTTPSADVTYTGRTLDIKSGNLTVSQNSGLQAQNVSKNTNKVKVGSFILKAGSSEGVRVTNIRVDLTLTGTGFTLNNLSNLYISENTTPVMPQSQNNFPVNFTLAANESKTIDVFADLGEMIDDATVKTTLSLTGVTTPSNSSVTPDAVIGQIMTAKTGTLADPTLVNNSPVAKLVAANSANETVATYKFVASNSAVNVSELTFKVTKGNGSTVNATAVQSVTVNGVTAPVVFDGSNYVASLTGLNLSIAAGTQGQNVEVKAAFNNVTSAGQGGAASDNDTKLVMTGYKYIVGNTTTPVTGKSIASNTMVLVAGYPTIVDTTSSSITTDLTPGGSNEVMRFSVSAGNSNINLKQIAMSAIYSYTLTSGKVMIYDVDDQNTILNNGDQTIGATGVETSYTFDNNYTINAGQTKNFIVKVDNTGTTTVGNYFRIDLTSADTLSTGTAWQWNDGTTDSYFNGYLVKNLPITGKTFTKK